MEEFEAHGCKKIRKLRNVSRWRNDKQCVKNRSFLEFCNVVMPKNKNGVGTMNSVLRRTFFVGGIFFLGNC